MNRPKSSKRRARMRRRARRDWLNGQLCCAPQRLNRVQCTEEPSGLTGESSARERKTQHRDFIFSPRRISNDIAETWSTNNPGPAHFATEDCAHAEYFTFTPVSFNLRVTKLTQGESWNYQRTCPTGGTPRSKKKRKLVRLTGTHGKTVRVIPRLVSACHRTSAGRRRLRPGKTRPQEHG